MDDHRPTSFYHILMNPSSPHLPLPTSFVRKHLGNRILKDPILKTSNGGYSWKLKMKKFDDHTFCFVNGWCNVVKDVGLLFGEFLLFRYVGSSVFLMHVYSVNGCEKTLVPRSSNFKVDVEDDAVDDDGDDDVEYDVEEDDEEVDDVDVELGDDGEDGDDSEDEDEDYVDFDGHDGDPYFIITSSKRNKYKLRFPPDLVAWATIKTKETITLKNDDGYEKEMPVRSYKQNKSTRYFVAEGWKEFRQSNDISQGDVCVLKFITSEDKLCLAKVTKKKRRATKVDNDDMDNDDGMDEAEYAKEDDSNIDADDIFEDDVDEEDKGENARHLNDDEDDGRDVVDDDVDEEDTGENAKLVNDDENENEDVEPVDEVDPFFVVDITTSNKHMLRLPPDFVELAGIDGKTDIIIKCPDGNERQMVLRPEKQCHLRRYCLSRGWTAFRRSNNISEGDECVFKYITSEDKMCLARVTKEKTSAAPPTQVDDNDLKVDDGKDVVVDDNKEEDGKDVVVDGNKDEDENVELVVNGMAGKDMVVDDNKDVDETVELVDVGMDGKDVLVDDNTDDDENVELVDDGIGKDVMVDGNKDNDENVELVDGMAGKDVVVYDNKGVDENVELVVDGMAGKDVVVKDNKDMDENVELINGMAGKDVVVDDNKDVNENVELVDDGIGMDGKDVVVVDNKDKDESVNLVDDGMDGKDVVVDDHKHGDENIEFVDDGFDIDADDNKDEDKDTEFVDGHPFFVVTMTPSHKSKLRLPTDFVASAGIASKKNIIMKSLDGNETKMSIRTDKRRYVSAQYHLSVGWRAFKKSNNISEGDECLFKYTASENKMYLAKLTKKENVNVDDNMDEDEYVELVDNGIDDRDVNGDDNKDKDESVNLVDDGMDGKDVVVDDHKHGDENIEFVDDGFDIDADDNKDEDKDTEFVDGHPFFVVTMTPSHKSKLRLPTDFVASAGIASKKNIIMKSLDGNETKMSIRTDKRRYVSAQYHLSVGWRAFKKSNNISEGDECLFKYTASENKMYLAKLTKKENVNVDDNMDEDEYVELVDNGIDDRDVNGDDNKDVDECVELVDGMDDKDVDVDDNKVENENAEHVDDEDPFFRVTITPSHKSMLRLPPDFVGLAGINTNKNIIIKSLDGNESQMAVRSDRRFNTAQYHLLAGWVAFKQRNSISQGDECVFKYIASEDKLCLAKITKTSATEANVDPFFVVTITPFCKSRLWLPADFVGLAGIETKENIIVKSIDGNETQIALHSHLCKRNQLKRYSLSIGWAPFKRSNNISEGDECEFKYITCEDKMCLAKVTKEKTRTMLPSPAEVVKRKRGRLPPAAEIQMTAVENVKTRSRRPPPVEITVAESVKRKRGPPPPSSPRVTKDAKKKKGQR